MSDWFYGQQPPPVFPDQQVAVPPPSAMPPVFVQDIVNALGRSLGNAARGTLAGAQEAAAPFVAMAAYPGQVAQMGYRGEAPGVEQMVPWAANTAMTMAGTGSPFAPVGAAGSAGGKLFTPEGAPISGTAFRKQSQSVLAQLAEEPKGTGPLDLASASGIPNVPQTPLERYTPPRGVSKRMQDALNNPDVVAGVKQSIEEGKAIGADKWYHTEPIRQAFVNELGPQEGMRAFGQYMDQVAATSPRSDVPTNIRNASYYYMLARQGAELPTPLPYPYGHMAQNLHRQNYASLSAAGTEGPGGFNVLQNPKPASFSQNLQGNLDPVTVDTHAFRNIAMRTEDPRFLATSVRAPVSADPGAATLASRYGEINPEQGIVTFRPRKLFEDGKLTMADAKQIPSFWDSIPLESEYAAVENFYRRLAAEHGLAPADAQAAAWAGGGKLTGLGSPPAKTFPELFNERVAYTGRMREEDPRTTLLRFIRAQAPLLGVGGAMLAPQAAPYLPGQQ